jgi:hypothetical protein
VGQQLRAQADSPGVRRVDLAHHLAAVDAAAAASQAARGAAALRLHSGT